MAVMSLLLPQAWHLAACVLGVKLNGERRRCFLEEFEAVGVNGFDLGSWRLSYLHYYFRQALDDSIGSLPVGLEFPRVPARLLWVVKEDLVTWLVVYWLRL